LVESLAAPADGDVVVYDDRLKGFGVRVTASGGRGQWSGN
jgi:hypothetical protein